MGLMQQLKSSRYISLLVARGVGVVLQVLMQLIVARLAGAAGVGLLQVFQTWFCVLGEVAALGLPTQVMKTVSVYQNGKHGLQILWRSLRFLAVASLVLALLWWLLWPWVSQLLPFGLAGHIALLCAVPCFAVIRVSTSILKAMDRPDSAVFTETALLPLFVIGACLVALVVPVSLFEGGEWLLVVTVTCLFCVSLVSLLLTVKRAIELIQTDPEKDLQQRLLVRELPYFWGTAIISIGLISLPFLVLPSVAEASDIGLFSIAFKLLNPITTLLLLLGSVFGPRFARAATEPQHSRHKLRSLLWQTQGISMVVYLPFLVGICFFIDPVLRLFGEEFLQAKVFIYILAAAQLVNALTGLAGQFLNMAGAGDKEFQGSLIFFVLGMAGAFYGGQQWGAVGVAIAYSLALAGKNIWSYVFAYRMISGDKADRMPLDVG